MATVTDLERILAMLATAYPSAPEVTPQTLELYRITLEDVPTNLLKAAVVQHVATSRFFPTIAELRESAFRLVDAAGGREDAYAAWGKVLAAVRRFGTHNPPRLDERRTDDPPGWRFENPLIASAVEAIGWRAICLSDETDSSVRARFIAAYEAYQKREREDARMLPAVRAQVDRLIEAKQRAPLPDNRKPVPMSAVAAELKRLGSMMGATMNSIKTEEEAQS